MAKIGNKEQEEVEVYQRTRTFSRNEKEGKTEASPCHLSMPGSGQWIKRGNRAMALLQVRDNGTRSGQYLHSAEAKSENSRPCPPRH